MLIIEGWLESCRVYSYTTDESFTLRTTYFDTSINASTTLKPPVRLSNHSGTDFHNSDLDLAFEASFSFECNRRNDWSGVTGGSGGGVGGLGASTSALTISRTFGVLDRANCMLDGVSIVSGARVAVAMTAPQTMHPLAHMKHKNRRNKGEHPLGWSGWRGGARMSSKCSSRCRCI